MGRKKVFTDDQKIKFVENVSAMLELQMMPATSKSIIDDYGNIKAKALGYAYGWTDAALRSVGQDMSDMSISIPILFNILYRLFPNKAELCMQHLIDNIETDQTVLLGTVAGGTQFNEMRNGKRRTPMGFGMLLSGMDPK